MLDTACSLSKNLEIFQKSRSTGRIFEFASKMEHNFKCINIYVWVKLNGLVYFYYSFVSSFMCLYFLVQFVSIRTN